MKKTFLSKICAVVVCCATLLGTTACKPKNPESSTKGMITVKPLEISQLGNGFNADYLPDVSNIRQYSGKIDVCLDFEGTQDGWKALAAEYERLQGGAVKVEVNTTISGSQYTQKLNEELNNRNTDWDIVEGNLGYSSTTSYCIDMFATISSPNPYAGKDRLWSEVLQPSAWKTKEADNSGVSYILNTEVMQTCWFINDVAFQKAVDKGYKNADGEAAYPITWDDLINLCVKMEEAGYTNPLGITLCNASIESLQFTWLLRVYGDYYYRQFYKYIMGGSTDEVWDNYDPTATVVENNSGFGYKYAKILNMLFERDCKFGEGYVGFTSEVYRDFVSQLAKIKGHLIKNVASTEFGTLRDQFETQSGGMGSAQILLDYQGFGINYEKAETDSFKLGYFDYPTMESGTYSSGENKGEYIVDPETITRDIGGNGGFLSVVNHTGNGGQNELNKDFVKFVMSPYGQTIYYKALAQSGAVPKGLSTVKNNLVVIPNEWVSFFNKSNETITFSGDVDANPFLGWGVRYTCGYQNIQTKICDYWRNLLMTGLADGQSLSVAVFCAQWAEDCEKDMLLQVANNGWTNEFWKDPNTALY